jgi:hypothetical protein
MSVLEFGTATLYASGFDSLLTELAAIRRRIVRGRPRADDLDDLDGLELALAELRALYRAALRVELEGAEEPLGPLDVALVQAEELLVDDLSLRTIPLETREALRRDREADWSVVLYGLADSGGTPPRR